MNIFHLFVPAFFDSISSILQYTSLNFISASIFQMLKGGTVVTTFIFSVIFLNLKVRKFQVYGCTLVLLGVLIIGANNMFYTNSEKNDEEKTVRNNYI
jgi:drug/metabolite transporter (DMT)-like permease